MESKIYYLTNEEFEKFLNDIDGLTYCYITHEHAIFSRSFFAVNNGWLGVIKELIEELIKLGWDKRICQVKEKFGGLRFYPDELNDEGYQLILKSEKLSYLVCEICGEVGELRNDIGWYRTLCDKHYNEFKDGQKNLKNNSKV